MKKLLLLLATVGVAFTACEKESIKETNSYQLGDLVEQNGVKGVVFYLGVNGDTKIVSVEEGAPSKWGEVIVEKEVSVNGVTKTVQIYTEIGAYNWYNGAKNMAAISSVSNWTTTPEAFNWCANYGPDWYLPAAYELKEIWYRKEIVNATLSQHGYPIISNELYWSSTESNAHCAGVCNMGSGNFNYIEKRNENCVRAVIAF